MPQVCPQCGFDAGFSVTVCPSCGHSDDRGAGGSPKVEHSAGDRWEKTVIESDFTPMPGQRRGEADDFYRTLHDDPARARFNARGGQGPDQTIIDRGSRDAIDDRTVIVRGGHRGVEGPLVYLVERTGIRAGRVHLLQPETAIGRDPENNVVLGDESVSKRHAKVRLEDGKFVFWDLASTNFSFVVGADGKRTRILERTPLEDGITVDIGNARLTYIEVDRGDAAE